MDNSKFPQNLKRIRKIAIFLFILSINSIILLECNKNSTSTMEYNNDIESNYVTLDILPESSGVWLGATKIGQYFEGRFGTADYVHVEGSYAYVANYNNDGLQILNISDPSNPKKVSEIDSDQTVKCFDIQGNIGYIAETTEGIIIINLEDLENPVTIGQFKDGGTANGVYIKDNYAFVADGEDGLEILDISNPTNPIKVGQFDDGGSAYKVIVKENIAYVADYYDGLEIIDVTDSTNPKELGKFQDIETAFDVKVINDFAYLANGANGIKIIDISNPADPIEMGHFDDDGDGKSMGIWISGDFAFVADAKEGLEILDISDPTNIIEIDGYFDSTGHAHGVFMHNGYVYVADDYDGLEIIDPGYDEDEDGLTTGDEINNYHSDPLDRDSDGDFIKDGSDMNPNSFFLPTGIGLIVIPVIFIGGIFGILKIKQRKLL